MSKVQSAHFESLKIKFTGWLDKAKKDRGKPTSKASNQTQEEHTTEPNLSTDNVYVLVKKEQGKTPSGKNFAKVYIQGTNHPFFANEQEVLQQIALINEGQSFIGETEDQNGFSFLKSVSLVNQIKTA